MGHHYSGHHGAGRQVGNDSMITTNNIKEAPLRRIWYLVETPMHWDGEHVMSMYDIRSEYAVKHDLEAGRKIINEGPLTMAEAKAFKKLLTGVQS